MPITIKLYNDEDHGLRDVNTGEQIPYWNDLYKWLAERRMTKAVPAR